MSDPLALHSATRTKTYSTIADDDAIKTSIATSLAAQQYTGGALNGAIGGDAMDFPRTVSVTTSASVASYKTGADNPIVYSGTYQGESVTESLLLTAANGAETIRGTQPFDRVSQIAPAAQNDINGHFKFGAEDIVLDPPARELRGGSAGNLKVQFQGETQDTVPALAGEHHKVIATRVISNGTTALPVTIYL